MAFWVPVWLRPGLGGTQVYPAHSTVHINVCVRSCTTRSIRISPYNIQIGVIQVDL